MPVSIGLRKEGTALNRTRYYLAGFFLLIFFPAYAALPTSEKTPPKNWFYRNFSLEANTTLMSDYIFRGVSQTNGGPAMLGEFRLKSKSGLYTSIVGNNVNFLDTQGNTVTTEIDYTFGFEREIHDIDLDMGAIYYTYPQATGVSYVEFFVGLSYKILLTSVYYSNNVFASGHSGTYYLAGVHYTLPTKIPGISIGAHVGYYDLNGPVYGSNSYSDYGVYIQKEFGYFTIQLAWTDTDGGFRAGNLDDSRVVVSISASIPRSAHVESAVNPTL